MNKRVLILMGALQLTASAISIPGYSPKDYVKDDKVPILVGAVKSEKLNLAYPYYAMDMCQSDDGNTDFNSVWGEKGISPVTGDHMNDSPYSFQFNHHKQCIPMCKKTYQSLDVSRL